MMNFEEFRKQYEQQHPASLPMKPRVVGEYPNWLRLLVGLMFVSAALVSGIHTVPTIRRTFDSSVADWVGDGVAAMSFFAVELAIFTSAYLRRKNKVLAERIMALTVLVALAANLYSVVKVLAVGGEVFPLAVSLILGAGSPFIAMMSGEMFVNMTDAFRREDSTAEANYREEMKEFDRQVNSAWAKWQKDETQRVPHESPTVHIPVQRMNSLNEPNEREGQGYSANSSTGYSKRMDARSLISEFFRRHPERMGDRLDELVPAIEAEMGVKVGRTSIHNVRQELLNPKTQPEAHSNGSEDKL